MNDYTKALQQNAIEQEEGREKIAVILRDVGLWCIEEQPDDLPEGAPPHIRKYHENVEAIDQATRTITRMEEIDTRQEQIKQLMRGLRHEQDMLFRGMEPVYEQIGAVAFRLFREHPLVDNRYSSTFEDLARYHDEIRDLDVQLRRAAAAAEDRQPGFLARLGEKGRSTLLKSRRSSRENRLPRLLRSAGEQLSHGDFLDTVQDEELDRAAEPLREVRQRSRSIDDQLAELERESGALLEEFNSLSNGSRLHRAREKRETEIHERRADIQRLLYELGRCVAEQPGRTVPEEPLSRLAEASARMEHLKDREERLEAGREAEKKAQQISRCQEDQQRTREEISRLQTRLETLEGHEASLTAEKESLEERRGTVEDLFGT